MEASISGRPIRPAAAMPAAAMAVTALVVAALILSSCAVPLVLGKAVDPLELLAPGELAYLRMDGATARLLAPAILPAGKGRSLSPLLERTSALALGLGLPTEKGPSFDAVFLGSYPYRGAAFALGGDSKWKREALGLATTRELGPMLARAHGGGANPLPARFAAAAGTGLALWVPEPFSRLAEELFGMSMNVPVRGLFIVAKREEAPSKGSISAEGANAEARYEVSAIFVMDGTDAAQTYRPILRLAWYGLSRYLLEDGADALLAAKFSLEGETYASAPFELDSAQLAAAIAKLGGFGKESGAGR
jgi:hypothetical protein